MFKFLKEIKFIYFLIPFFFLCLAGCGDDKTPGGHMGVKPTVKMVSPSLTPTHTPTPFPTATDTPTPRPTDTPTPTATLAPDCEPPVIIGAADIEAKVNGTISYTRNVTATDNSGETFSFRGETPNLWVDKSNVNISKAGTYEITYHAQDKSGNTSEVTVSVLVSKASPDEVYALADTVLGRILTDDMTMTEKARAIFEYVHQNVKYQDRKGNDYIENAYYGLEDNIGDCNVFAATSKVLLTKAGIPNLDIKKYPVNNDPHIWNLVNTGDGWYHFDTTVWHPDTADKEAREQGIFMWTTERLKRSGSGAIRNQHVFDASLYPEIQ